MAISGVTGYTNTYSAERTSGTSKSGGDTQEYLSQLKAKYPDVNITVADFGSERQSTAYMLGSRGYNNIAVSPNIIEKMASDPSTAERYESVFEEISHNSERVEKFAKENNQEILGAGAVIDKNGKVSYWMVGRSKDKFENPGTVYKDKIQQQIKEKREKEKAEEAAKQKRLEKSETMEKLLKKFSDKAHEIASETIVKKQENSANEKGEKLDLKV